MSDALHDRLAPLPLIAILRGLAPEDAVATAEVLVDCGFVAIEVPMNSPRPFASIEAIAQAFGDKALVGGGTLRQVDELQRLHHAGGRLAVMPHCDLAIVSAAKVLGLFAVPGVATPSEAFAGLGAGADALKLFPAEMLTPPAVKAIRAVLPPDVWLLPVGGITPERMAEYWAAGANGFGLGSALFKPGQPRDTLRANATAFAEAMAALRAKP
jgi:2-dehydro-3-deoxyphosphogalactonate aldolase